MTWLAVIPILKYVVPFVVGWFAPRPQDIWGQRIEVMTEAVEELSKTIK